MISPSKYYKCNLQTRQKELTLEKSQYSEIVSDVLANDSVKKEPWSRQIYFDFSKFSLKLKIK